MRAAVCVAGRLEVREWPVPRPGPGELLLRVRGCGLCGSDLAKLGAGPGAGPAVLGHEVVGDVVETGPGIPRFRRGERVGAGHHVPCFACHYCRRGSPTMCRAFKRVNLDPGGFAEFVRIPAPNVAHATFRVPPGMSDEAAAFTEPLACCLRAVKRAGVGAGDSALVVGLGSIGCLIVQLLALRGVRVFGADLAEDRATLGRSAGAVVPPAGELERSLRDATEGRGVDVVLLTAGGADALPAAVAAVRDGGALHVFAGGAGETLPVALDTLYHRELTIAATYSASPEDLEEAFDLLRAGRIRAAELVTHRLPLARLAEGVRLMRERRAVKVYVTPGAPGEAPA